MDRSLMLASATGLLYTDIQLYRVESQITAVITDFTFTVDQRQSTPLELYIQYVHPVLYRELPAERAGTKHAQATNKVRLQHDS